MFLNDYSVRVPEGKEDGDAYVALQHETKFTLVLRNNHSTRCDARVELNGKYQGTWRIEAKDSITLQRPGHDRGRFTFYKLGTKEGELAGLAQDDPNAGLVKVEFTPEFENRPKVRPLNEQSAFSLSKTEQSFSPHGSLSSLGASRRSAGGIGLSGHSSQDFDKAERLSLDYSKTIVIHLRLVCEDVDTPRPLTNYSNPVPPPIH